MIINVPSGMNKVPNIEHLNVCGVVVTATVTNSTFNEVYQYYKDMHRSNWKGSLSTKTILDGIGYFGSGFIRSNQLITKFKGKRIKDLMNYLSSKDPENVYVVTTYNHIQTIQGNRVVDQSGLNLTEDYRWKNLKVDLIYQIKSIGDKRMAKKHMTKRTSKYSRAVEIVKSDLPQGKTRKEILFRISDELDTTWNAASTFYYKAKKELSL